MNIRETHRIMHPDCPYCTPSESTGATQMALDLIAAERLRQVTQEGWTARHDSTHADDDLARAAACYALPPGYRGAIPNQWPWAAEWWKPSKDRIRELVKAGALIAAEIDRRLVLNQTATEATLAAQQAPEVPEDTLGPDEEQAALRAQVERLVRHSPEHEARAVIVQTLYDLRTRAEAAETEVERLRTHIRDNTGGQINGLEANDWFQIATAKEQALDATVTELNDARERLRRCEERLAKVEALPNEWSRLRDGVLSPGLRKAVVEIGEAITADNDEVDREDYISRPCHRE